MLDSCEEDIINTWLKNAKPWIKAVRYNEIESRVLITNKSIQECILKESPDHVLDVGCGEGWLVRELSSQGINSVGIDIVPELITAALDKNMGDYRVLSYKDISKGKIKEIFDVIVCNFSLLGDESVSELFKQIPFMLNNTGCLIVQTIHPLSSCDIDTYEDGWRKGSWHGFSHQFTDPAPWYFRTLESWKNLFNIHQFKITEILEPINPKTGEPASIIFICNATHVLLHNS